MFGAIQRFTSNGYFNSWQAKIWQNVVSKYSGQRSKQVLQVHNSGLKPGFYVWNKPFLIQTNSGDDKLQKQFSIARDWRTSDFKQRLLDMLPMGCECFVFSDPGFSISQYHGAFEVLSQEF